MGTVADVSPWSTIADEAIRHREQVLEQLRQWGARLHLARLPTPTRWAAAHDAAGRPFRLRILQADEGATDRDRAEAAADDLWDALAVAWGLVRSFAGARPAAVPPLERVVAELQLAGRWLAGYRVSVAAHERAIDRLFTGDAEPTPCDR